MPFWIKRQNSLTKIILPGLAKVNLTWPPKPQKLIFKNCIFLPENPLKVGRFLPR